MVLRVVIADDERPARAFLTSLLRDFDDVEIVGEATNGAEAIEVIEDKRPDMALLDLQMPELGGLEVVRLLNKKHMPLVAFVTAYDEYAVRAFELNAIDYMLKPVSRARLREAINRASERLERDDLQRQQTVHIEKAVAQIENESPPQLLERIPVRKRDDIVIVPVDRIAAIEADGELLHTSPPTPTSVTRSRVHSKTSRLVSTRNVSSACRAVLSSTSSASRPSPRCRAAPTW